jgi:hypothetical protein
MKNETVRKVISLAVLLIVAIAGYYSGKYNERRYCLALTSWEKLYNDARSRQFLDSKPQIILDTVEPGGCGIAMISEDEQSIYIQGISCFEPEQRGSWKYFIVPRTQVEVPKEEN